MFNWRYNRNLCWDNFKSFSQPETKITHGNHPCFAGSRWNEAPSKMIHNLHLNLYFLRRFIFIQPETRIANGCQIFARSKINDDSLKKHLTNIHCSSYKTTITQGALKCSEGINSPYSINDTGRVTLVTNLVTSHEIGKKDQDCNPQVFWLKNTNYPSEAHEWTPIFYDICNARSLGWCELFCRPVCLYVPLFLAGFLDVLLPIDIFKPFFLHKPWITIVVASHSSVILVVTIKLKNMSDDKYQ